MNIESELNALLHREGGYVNNPNDTGGETIWGITRGVAVANGYSGPMKDLPLALAKEIYRKQYWTGPGFDKLAQVSPGVATELFDTGVNMGPKVASVFLQRSLNALNRQGRDYADLTVDGNVGPATCAALKAFITKRGDTGESVVLKALNCLQGARYIELAEGRQANEEFVFGWLNSRIYLN